MKDFVSDNKIAYGTYIYDQSLSSTKNAFKIRLDSAGKKIRINLKKMHIAGYGVGNQKQLGDDMNAQEYYGGNRYVMMLGSNPHVSSRDKAGYIDSFWVTIHPATWWGIYPSFCKIDGNGNATFITAPKRDNVLGAFEYISPIETLLQEYPPLYKKYMSELHTAYKSDAKYYFSWLLGYFKTYANMLEADMDKKNKSH